MTIEKKAMGTMAHRLFFTLLLSLAPSGNSIAENAVADEILTTYLTDVLRLYERAPVLPGDDATGFVYRAPISASLTSHHEQWQAGSSSNRQWNDSYWPTYRGIIAHRYGDKTNVPTAKSWSTHHAYFLSMPGDQLLSNGQQDKLSPAEKYDLLVGNTNWTLTQYNWGKGANYMSTIGKVPTWFGFCHGWAGASHMGEPHPTSAVTAIGVNGVPVTFNATDIRALQTYMWAESAPKARHLGVKCTGASPENGLPPPESSACLDNNPMSWHLALLHRVGRDRDSFVMDVSKNFEIWNFALDSYYFRYFNPRTLKTFRHWRDAIIDRSEYPNDPFAATRAATSRYLVGVTMDVFYPSALEPRPQTSDDRLYQSKSLTYDLELDDTMTIVGGEWHSDEHPDFLWTFNFDAKAGPTEDAAIDPLLTPWLPGTPLPPLWATQAQKASGTGDVLRSIVHALVQQSLVNGAPADDPEGDVEAEL